MNTTTSISKYLLLVITCFSFACSGSNITTTSSSNTSRSITGILTTSTSASLNKYLSTETCSADSVIATDTQANTTTAPIAEDCSFNLDLTINKNVSLGFVQNETFVAALTFNSGNAGLSTSTLPITTGSTPINLGAISITGQTAIPTTNPLIFADSDGDGLTDYEDSDDDADGIADNNERDCDLDGVIDDMDEDSSCTNETMDTNIGYVLEVKPRNKADDEAVEGVDLNKKVRARINCVIDQSSVTNETYIVLSDDGETIACEFQFSTSDDNESSQIKCRHDNQDFTPSTNYTATISGLSCEDGRQIEATSWTWFTEENDDDEGDAEDDLDEIDEDSTFTNNSDSDSDDDEDNDEDDDNDSNDEEDNDNNSDDEEEEE
ncbi:hypothetical protein BVY03_05070 [bacterium K02(2017)]|nr:hypothetical protein BVY03_05070 [bacterium K02(2017)]